MTGSGPKADARANVVEAAGRPVSGRAHTAHNVIGIV